MTLSDSHALLQRYIPTSLLPEERDQLLRDLRSFPANSNLFYCAQTENPLQGDGWRGFSFHKYHNGEKRDGVAGIILSNSCDIDPENLRDVESWVLFAPLISFSRYIERIEASGSKNESQIDDVKNSIRTQQITNLFYLPFVEGAEDETIAVLDRVAAEPLSAFWKNDHKSRLFSLSQNGIYLFLAKLGLHLMRIESDIRRAPAY